MRLRIAFASSIFFIFSFQVVFSQQPYHETYRPQVHFSPLKKWTNDPNGLVYYNGVYHLFFQYYPDSTVWGPMHWGHATSKDLVHWSQQPIALYPDSLGYIFSGSAVVDKNNSSGLGINGQPPLVAMFTHHDPAGAAAHRIDYQNQSLAYSNDGGSTWKKFPGNPVLKNPGIEDFRDPKLMWFAAANEWIVTLAVKDRVAFYSSADLKTWKKESEFGKTVGAHGGVWECPDLFPLQYNGKTVWVLIVNINPGGPNKGSATQYFMGSFDGKNFVARDTITRWLDYGPDEYAGITWFNTGDRRIFIGWMSNWLYANLVPTREWRNAMTIPRELSLQNSSKGIVVASRPVPELKNIEYSETRLGKLVVKKDNDLSAAIKEPGSPYRLDLSTESTNDFSLVLSNDRNQSIIIGFNANEKKYFIDRTKSGDASFYPGFDSRYEAPRMTDAKLLSLTLVVDHSSVELFADNGMTVMTGIFFADQPYNHLHILSPGETVVSSGKITLLRSIWP